MADPAVWITGTGPDKQLNFRLPTGGRGDKGDKGDKGADGSNVLPTDTAIANAVNASGSATKTALSATYATKGEVGSQAEKLPLFSHLATKARTGVVKVQLAGTSISAADMSTARVIPEWLKTLFGDTNATIHNLGAIGGGYQNDYSGWKKQPFGGLGYYRLTSTATSAAFNLTGHGDTVEFWYSKESDGGAFSVSIDGVSYGTVNTNGAQAYRQKAVFSPVLQVPVITLGTTAGSGGTFGAGTYYWKVTAYNSVGETVASNEVTATLAANGTQVLNWAELPSVAGYKVYRGTAAGAENTLVTTISTPGTVTYTDTGIAGTAATPPASGTVRALGPHTVTITPPATPGTTPARLEYLIIADSQRKGVEVYNGTLGGSSLWNATTLRAPQTGQVAGIPITGNTGLDSLSGTDMDLFIFEHHFNDVGVEADNGVFEANAARILNRTRDNGQPVLWMTEPAGNAYSNAKYTARRNSIKALSAWNNTTVIDWHQAIWPGNPDNMTQTEYIKALKQYYPVTITNENPLTFTGDSTHPDQRAYDPLNWLVAGRLGIDAPRAQTVSATARDRLYTLPSGVGLDAAATVDSTAVRFAVPSGPAAEFLVGQSSDADPVRIRPYYRRSGSTNYAANGQNTINNSALSDQWGKYVDWNNQNVDNGNQASPGRLWLVFKASGTVAIRVGTPNQYAYIDGVKHILNDSGAVFSPRYVVGAGVQPVVFAVQYQASAARTIGISGRVYEVALTNSTVPLLL